MRAQTSQENPTEPISLDNPKKPNLLLPHITRWTAEQGPIISLKDVWKSFGETKVIKGLSLDIVLGQTTVIIGASPSGKSVLIKLMNGLMLADSGEVLLFGQNPSLLGDQELDELRKRMGTLFQNYALFDSMTVRQNAAFPLIEHGAVGQKEADALAEAIITELDLEHALDLFPSSLSGGMKKRVALARAMIANPELILFDEPTTGLDPIMMEFVDDMIRQVNQKYGLTSVIISHDMASTFRLADSIAVLYDGTIIAHGTPQAIKASTDERVRRLIFASDKTDIGQSDEDAAGGAKGAAAQAAKKPRAVETRGLRKSFDGREVLKGVDFWAPEGEITVLIGGSGSGKSVLMKHILGLFEPDSGDVFVLGKEVTKLPDQELALLRSEIGMLFQHAALFDSMTIEDNIMFPLLERRQSVSATEARARAKEVMAQLKLESIAQDLPPGVSNGQQKRASLARALVTHPKMMIYDEPTTGQDPIMCDYVEKMIVEVQESFDITSIIISHDMASTFRIGDHVAMLYLGEIIAQGPPHTLLDSPDERVQEFVFAADVADKKRDDDH